MGSCSVEALVVDIVVFGDGWRGEVERLDLEITVIGDFGEYLLSYLSFTWDYCSGHWVGTNG